MLKTLKTTAYITVIIWLLTGILIVASIINDTMGASINLFMGVVFIAIAYYLYIKTQNSLTLLQIPFKTNVKNIKKQFFRIELVFFILNLLFGLLLLSGVISRVFVEKMAVFG